LSFCVRDSRVLPRPRKSRPSVLSEGAMDSLSLGGRPAPAERFPGLACFGARGVQGDHLLEIRIRASSFFPDRSSAWPSP
jgi:hypothetical protein